MQRTVQQQRLAKLVSSADSYHVGLHANDRFGKSLNGMAGLSHRHMRQLMAVRDDSANFASRTRRMELHDSPKGATDCCCYGDADLPPQNRSELTKYRRNHRKVSFVSQTATPAWIEGTQEKMLDSWTTGLNDTFPCRLASSRPCRDVGARSPLLSVGR